MSIKQIVSDQVSTIAENLIEPTGVFESFWEVFIATLSIGFGILGIAAGVVVILATLLVLSECICRWFFDDTDTRAEKQWKSYYEHL